MNKTAFRSNICIIVAIGSIWGLTEFAFGLGLQICATLMVGFILLVGLFGKRFSGKLGSRIMVGAGVAAIACALFPLAKFSTGNPASMYAATNIPLVIYTAPVAIILSMITVPLGFRAATWYSERSQGLSALQSGSLLARFWSPAVAVCCLLIITLVRII